MLFAFKEIMAKEWAKKFYKSKQWLKCRASYIAKRIAIDGGLCEECKEHLGYMVHHKIILTPENINDPEIALNHDYLAYECKDCHDRHEGHGVGRRGQSLLVLFDDDGQPVPLPPKKYFDS